MTRHPIASLPIVASAILFFALALPLPAQLDRAPDRRTISTSGEAVVYVVPDQAIVSFGVETFDKDLDKAVAANAAACAKLVKALKEMNIEDKYVATDVVSVTIGRDYRPRHTDEDGFTVTRSYAVTLKDVKQLEKLIQSALHNGANLLRGVDFQTTELRKHRDAARQMAIRAAKEKAALLAKELQCNVGKPRAINETGFSYWGYSNRYNSYGNVQAQSQVASGAGDAGGEGGEAMPLGQVGVRATVSVTFDLAD
jgi:uncharacterized protein YggE